MFLINLWRFPGIFPNAMMLQRDASFVYTLKDLHCIILVIRQYALHKTDISMDIPILKWNMANMNVVVMDTNSIEWN